MLSNLGAKMGFGDNKLYTLHYFDARGLAEPIRLLLTYGDVKWEDKRIPLPMSAFPPVIPEEVKAISPYGQVPVLEVDGTYMSQAQTITRFLGRKFNLAGKDEWEAAKCDEYADATKDLFTNWIKVSLEKDDTEKERLKKETTATSMRYLKSFNDILEINGSGYLIGDSLTWADIYLAHFLDNIEKINKVDLTLTYPALKKMLRTVFHDPKLSEYIVGRPDTPF